MSQSLSSEKELEILQEISRKEDVKQRDLAEIAGMSLGMTNAIVKRLAKKGLLKIQRLNNKTLKYAVSPAGMDYIAKKSFSYLKRTIKNIADYKSSIFDLLKQQADSGNRSICLVGESDLEFIVEHCCDKIGLQYHTATKKQDDPAVVYIFSELVNPINHVGKSNEIYLQKELMNG